MRPQLVANRFLPASISGKQGLRLLALACVSVAFGAIAPALQEIQTDFNEGLSLSASLVSIFSLGRLVSAIPAGLLVDRAGPGRVAVGGACAFVFGSALGALAPASWVLIVGRFFQGVGLATVPAGVLALTMSGADRRRTGGAMATYQLSISIGQALGSPIAGWLIQGFGWRSSFVFCAAAGLTAVGCAMPSLGARAERPAVSAVRQSRMGLVAWGVVLLVLLPNVVAAFHRFAVNFLTLPLYLAGPLRWDPTATGALIGVVTLVSMATTWPAGWACSRWGSRPVIAVAAALSLLGLVLIPAAPGVEALVVVVLIFALGSGILSLAGAVHVFSLPSRSMGMTVTLYRLSTDVVQVVGPYVVGIVLDTAGFAVAFYGVGAVAVLALIGIVVRPGEE